MRSVPSDIASKLAMKKQTRANSADPSASIWIGRPTTSLTTDVFLERQAVLTDTSITDVSVAVCHPRQGAANTKINMAYISGGVAHVVTALEKTKMQAHTWIDSGFAENASSVSVAYDGTMPKNDRGNVEFVTENQPWVFWAYNGALYARKIGSLSTTTLAESNCTDVSAVRAMWSEIGDFDFGLVVFFILSGSIYYRQLISGEWTNAQLVSFGPESVTWVSIAASRTWDYRVALQVKSSAGVIYELFTQFMGIGKQNVEHINVASISAESETTEITYHNTKETENVEVSDISSVAPYGGLYSTAIPEIVNAYNIDDGTGNWGIYAIFVFNSQMVAAEVTAQASAFQIVDTNSIAYGASSASIGSDGLTVTLAFLDFNNARGVCTARYVPGTVKSMHGDSVLSTSLSFTPQNLVPSEVPLPEVEDVWNE